MGKLWWCCTKCDDVHDYIISGSVSSFPRGEFLAHNDYITTGFKSEQEARAYLDKEQGRPPAIWTRYAVRYRYKHGNGVINILATNEEDAKGRAREFLGRQGWPI